MGVSPPHSSGSSPFSLISCFTLSMLAPSLSICSIAPRSQHLLPINGRATEDAQYFCCARAIGVLLQRKKALRKSLVIPFAGAYYHQQEPSKRDSYALSHCIRLLLLQACRACLSTSRPAPLTVKATLW